MKRYYIISLIDLWVQWTDEVAVAIDFGDYDDFIVIDTETNEKIHYDNLRYTVEKLETE